MSTATTTTTTTSGLVVGEYVRLGRRGKLSYRVWKITDRRIYLSGLSDDGRELFRGINHGHQSLIRERDLA